MLQHQFQYPTVTPVQTAAGTVRPAPAPRPAQSR